MHKNNKISITNALKVNPYIEYFSKFKHLTPSPTQLSAFSDALILLNLIQEIKDFSIGGQIIDSPRTFSDSINNLKVLFKSIQNYWNQHLKIELEIDEIDWIEIARSSNEQQIQKLLELFIKTTAQSENKLFIQKILQTSEETQLFLKKIVEKVFHSRRESPRKQKQKRMFDKIMELDHQNQKYQVIIRQIQNQKIELQGNVRNLSEKLAEKNKQLEQINYYINDDILTPRKRMVNHGVPDTSQRKQGLIQSLKKQVSDMSMIHEQQLTALYHQIQRLTIKAAQYDNIKNQLHLSREIIDSHKQFRQQAQRIQQESSMLKADLMSKDNHIEFLKEKLQKGNKMISQLQNRITMQKGNIQRKNIKINELAQKIEEFQKRFSPKKTSNHNILYLEFPQIMNTETQAYIQTNKYLREQLERTRVKLQASDQQLNRSSQQLKGLRGCENQNKRLKDIVIQLNSHRGQQNEILVSSLYHLRKMMQTRAF